MQLEHSRILITGAGSGIGRALARLCAKEGASLLLVGRREQALRDTQELLPPGAAEFLVADITTQQGRNDIMAACARRGGLDVLVNNAGIVPSGSFAVADDATAQRTMATNLLAPLALTRDLLPFLHRSPCPAVVNVGSVFGDIGHPLFALYCASKFALRGLSDALRRELAVDGIQVCYVAPRATQTDAAQGFADLIKPFGMAVDDADTAARQILNAMLRDKAESYAQGLERLFVLVQKLLPRLVDRALTEKLRRLRRQVTRVVMLAAACIAWFGMAQPCAAQSTGDGGGGFYINGKGGPSFMMLNGMKSGRSLADDTASNMIGAFGLAGGYTWSRQGLPLRTELEFMNRTEVTYDASPLYTGAGGNNALASTVQDVSLMLRGYWHFKAGDPNIWSPFISGGIGVARNAVKGNVTAIGTGVVQHLDKSSYSPAWSLGTGASFYLGHNVVNDVEFRYVDLGRANWGITNSPDVDAKLRGAELIFSLRYNF